MRGRPRRAIDLALGRSTPLLAANWSAEQNDLFERWRAGDPLLDEPQRLDEAMADSVGRQGVGLNSGRAAIQLALEALDLPPRSEVLIPSYGCAGIIVPITQ